MPHKSGKAILFFLTALLALSACAAPSAETAPPAPTPTPIPTPEPTPKPTPKETSDLWGFPIDDTHDAFEVPTGGKLGTVLVTVELKEGKEIGWDALSFCVWRSDDLTQPIQTMEVEESNAFHWKDVRDANFGGYMDFGYMYAMGTQPAYWHYWIWDEVQGLFVLEPEFDEISCPEFDEETGIISGYARDGDAGLSGHTTFHQWIDGRLVCIRRVETWLNDNDREGNIRLVTLIVQDQVDGELKTVFQKDYPAEEAHTEAQRWCDLNYHGE